MVEGCGRKPFRAGAFRLSSVVFPMCPLRLLVCLLWVGMVVGCRHLSTPLDATSAKEAAPPVAPPVPQEVPGIPPKPEGSQVRSLKGALFMGVATERGTGIIFSSERVDLAEHSPWSSDRPLPCRADEGTGVATEYGCYQLNSRSLRSQERGHELEGQFFCPLNFPQGAERRFPFGPSLALLGLNDERPVFEGALTRWGTISTGEIGACELALEARLGTMLPQGTLFLARSDADASFPPQVCPKVDRFSFDVSHPVVVNVLSEIGRAEALQGCHRVRVERILWSQFQGVKVDYDGDGIKEDVLHFVLTYEFSGNCRLEKPLPSGGCGTQWIYGLTGVAVSSRLMSLKEGKWIDVLPPWDGTEDGTWRKYELVDWIDLEGDGTLEVLTRNEYCEGTAYSLWRVPSSRDDLPLASTPWVVPW